MKVVYSREDYFGLIMGGFIGGLVLVLLIGSLIFQGFTRESITGGCGALLAAAMFIGAGAFSAKKARKFRAERKKLVSEGVCCEGEVIDFIHIRGSDNRKTYMQVRYFSTLLQREVIFKTPSTSMSIKEEPGIKCTVYEAYEEYSEEPMEEKPMMLNIKASEGEFVGVDEESSDGINRIVDTLDEETVKSTRLANTLFFIFVIILFAAAFYYCLKK